MSLLELTDVSSGYGHIRALWDVSLRVEPGEIVSVLGANGAGKSTLVKSIVGLQPLTSGAIHFEGDRIDRRPVHRISDLGIAYGPEGGGVFYDLNVLENLELGAYHRSAWAHRSESLERVFDLFPRLYERRRNLSRTLSGGERQMLVMGRALMARPKLCIFDEPTIGLAPVLVDELFVMLERIRDDGITVLLIEQNVRQSLATADRAYVLENGRVTLEGRSDELLRRDDIARAYLGL